MREPERLLASGATDFERKLLEAVKDERPSAELQQRMQQGLGLPSGTVPPAPSGKAPLPTSPSGPSPTGAVLGSGFSGVALKVILGSIVAGGLAYSVVSLTTVDGDRSVSASAVKRQGTTAAAPQRTSVVAPAADLSAAELPAAESSEAKRRSAPVEPSTKEMADDARRAPTDGDGLRLEIDLLDAVRAASLLGESERADEALERYDARFPRGALQREADLLRRGSAKATGAAPSAPSRGADPEAASGR